MRRETAQVGTGAGVARMRRTGRARGAGLAVALGVPFGLAFAAGPAAALMPPYVYENARRDAASIIVLELDKVTPPGAGYGECRVEGVVRVVERGTTFRLGDAARIDVPCVKPGAQPPLGGTIYQPVEALSASKYGRAWLDAEGRVVLSQYEQLKALP